MMNHNRNPKRFRPLISAARPMNQALPKVQFSLQFLHRQKRKKKAEMVTYFCLSFNLFYNVPQVQI